MALDQTANFVRATISSAIQAGDSIIDLSDSGQLIDPANGEYNLVVWDPSSYPRPDQDPAVEIVRATALDSGANELTVSRGQEGTSAADHPVEAVLQLSPTAKMFSDIDSKTSQLSADGQTYSGQSVDVEQLNSTHYIETSDTPQSVFDDAGADSTLVFERGTHTVSLDANKNGIQIDDSNVTVVIPTGAIVKLGNSEFADGDIGGIFQLTAGLSNISFIGGGLIDGNGANNPDSTSVTDFGAIRWIDNAEDITIRDIDVVDHVGTAITGIASSGNRASDVLIENCRIEDCSEGTTVKYHNNVTWRGLTIRNMTRQDGIEPAETSNWTIDDCYIDTTNQTGIDVFKNSNDGQISNCTIENTNTGGEKGAVGIGGTTACSDIAIDNVIVRNGNGGGVIFRQDTASSDITITDCFISNTSGIGVNILNADYENITVEGCLITSCAVGLQVDQGNSIKFIDNIVSESTESGIRVRNGTASDVVIDDNISKNNNQGGSNNLAGIMVKDSTRVTVLNNVCFDDQSTKTQEKGIYIKNGASEAFVQGNHLYGNSEDDLFAPNAPASALIQNNKTG